MILALKVSAFAFAAALIICGMDRNGPQITARHEQLAWEKKADVKPEEQVWIMLPIKKGKESDER